MKFPVEYWFHFCRLDTEPSEISVQTNFLRIFWIFKVFRLQTESKRRKTWICSELVIDLKKNHFIQIAIKTKRKWIDFLFYWQVSWTFRCGLNKMVAFSWNDALFASGLWAIILLDQRVKLINHIFFLFLLQHIEWGKWDLSHR